MNVVPRALAVGRRTFSTSARRYDFGLTEAPKYYVPKCKYYQNYIMKQQEFSNIPARDTYTHLDKEKFRLIAYGVHLTGFFFFILTFPERKRTSGIKFIAAKEE